MVVTHQTPPTRGSVLDPQTDSRFAPLLSVRSPGFGDDRTTTIKRVESVMVESVMVEYFGC